MEIFYYILIESHFSQKSSIEAKMAVGQIVMKIFPFIINHLFLYCLKAYLKRVTSSKNMCQIMTGNFFITFWLRAIFAKNHELRPKWLFLRWLWKIFKSLSTIYFCIVWKQSLSIEGHFIKKYVSDNDWNFFYDILNYSHFS